jgi:hypothetical protein
MDDHLQAKARHVDAPKEQSMDTQEPYARSGLRSRKAEIFHFSLRLIGKIFGEELLDLFIGAT